MEQAVLMHRDIPVAKVQMIANRISNIIEVYSKEELPVGVSIDNPMVAPLLLNSWVKSRTIPRGRPGMDKLVQKLGATLGEEVMLSNAVSLTDCYWIKENDFPITWADVNFYDNGFEPLFADYYKGKEIAPGISPDFTTDGCMEKAWVTNDGKPCLVKIDNEHDGVMCANEAVAYRICQEIGFDHVEYRAAPFCRHGEILYGCECPSMLSDSSTELVTAQQLSHIEPMKTGEELLRYIMQDMGFEQYIREIVTLDVLIGNQDRHEKNFCFYKDINGILTPAPIFDSGSSLGFNGSKHAELKTPRKYREQCANYLLPINLDEELLCRILKDTYEEFEISEGRYNLAREQLVIGMHIIEEQTKTKPKNALYGAPNIKEVEEELKR